MDSGVFAYGYGSSGSYELWTSTATPLAAGTWYYLAAVDDRTHNAKLYINGVLIGAVRTGNVGVPSAGFGETAIGRPGSFNGQYANAIVDDVSIFNVAITQADIVNLVRERPPQIPLK